MTSQICLPSLAIERAGGESQAENSIYDNESHYLVCATGKIFTRRHGDDRGGRACGRGLVVIFDIRRAARVLRDHQAPARSEYITTHK